MSWATLPRSPASLLGEHHGEDHDLQEQVAELAVLRREVVAGDGVGELVDLFDRVRDDVLGGLLAVPRALDAQHVDDALERDELLAEQGVVEGGAVGDGDDGDGGGGGGGRGRRRRARGARAPAPAPADRRAPR